MAVSGTGSLDCRRLLLLILLVFPGGFVPQGKTESLVSAETAPSAKECRVHIDAALEQYWEQQPATEGTEQNDQTNANIPLHEYSTQEETSEDHLSKGPEEDDEDDEDIEAEKHEAENGEDEEDDEEDEEAPEESMEEVEEEESEEKQEDDDDDQEGEEEGVEAKSEVEEEDEKELDEEEEEEEEESEEEEEHEATAKGEDEEEHDEEAEHDEEGEEEEEEEKQEVETEKDEEEEEEEDDEGEEADSEKPEEEVGEETEEEEGERDEVTGVEEEEEEEEEEEGTEEKEEEVEEEEEEEDAKGEESEDHEKSDEEEHPSTFGEGEDEDVLDKEGREKREVDAGVPDEEAAGEEAEEEPHLAGAGVEQELLLQEPETEQPEAEEAEEAEEETAIDEEEEEEEEEEEKEKEEVAEEEDEEEEEEEEEEEILVGGEEEEEEEEDFVAPSAGKFRSRDHIDRILGLDDIGTTDDVEEEKFEKSILNELRKTYETAVKPLEMTYKYRDITTRLLGDAEIFGKPMVLFLGPWSSGKSTIMNYLFGIERTPAALKTGPSPTDKGFTIVTYGEQRQVVSGTELAADWTYSSVQKFGQAFLDHFRGIRMNHRILQKITFVDTPGITENRKHQERGYPFNDALQWFIDRADAIYVVFDPTKLDIGAEMESVLDQLKGREAQIRFILNKADTIRRSDVMRIVGQLFWNLSPLMGRTEAPIIYAVSLMTKPFHSGAPAKFLHDQEKNFLYDLRETMDKRVENKILYARRHAVRVRNHAKMIDCYLATYYRQKSIFSSKKKVAQLIADNPTQYHIYEGLSTMTNISRYDLPDPVIYREFFRIHPLYDFQSLASTCSYFRGCPLDKLDYAIAYDLPELLGKYKKTANGDTSSKDESR